MPACACPVGCSRDASRVLRHARNSAPRSERLILDPCPDGEGHVGDGWRYTECGPSAKLRRRVTSRTAAATSVSTSVSVVSMSEEDRRRRFRHEPSERRKIRSRRVGDLGLTLTLTASAGNGPADCTRGVGGERHCLMRVRESTAAVRARPMRTVAAAPAPATSMRGAFSVRPCLSHSATLRSACSTPSGAISPARWIC